MPSSLNPCRFASQASPAGGISIGVEREERVAVQVGDLRTDSGYAPVGQPTSAGALGARTAGEKSFNWVSRVGSIAIRHHQALTKYSSSREWFTPGAPINGRLRVRMVLLRSRTACRSSSLISPACKARMIDLAVISRISMSINVSRMPITRHGYQAVVLHEEAVVFGEERHEVVRQLFGNRLGVRHHRHRSDLDRWSRETAGASASSYL